MRFSAEEWKNNQKIREAVAYIGFDPRKISDQFFTKVEENNRSDTDTLTDYGGVMLYENTRTDLMFFLNTFLERGNNLYKALRRCDETIGPIQYRACIIQGSKQGFPWQ